MVAAWPSSTTTTTASPISTLSTARASRNSTSPIPPIYNRLYRNNGNGTFTDVTVAAGVRGDGFATGVAAADYDNDGWEDLFIAGVNRNHPVPQSRRRNVRGCDGDGGIEPAGRRGSPGPSRPGGSTTTTTAGWICSW